MTGLLRVLEAEADAISRFVELLKLEQAALASGDIDKIVGFTQDKTTLASELTSLSNQRNSTLASLGLEADRAGVEAWCERQPPNVRARNAWSRILSLASEARELNHVNGGLIQTRMQYNAQALAAMQGASRSLHLYGPDGQTAPLLSGRINDAA